MKAHFSGDYDYVKYRGKVNASRASFDVRRDKMFFMKLAKHSDPRGVMVASFLEDPKTWIRTVSYSPTAEKRWVEWAKRVQSLSYNLKTELDSVGGEFSENVKLPQGEHPPMLQAYLAKRISLETLTAFVKETGIGVMWDGLLVEDPVWEETRKLCKKYEPFLQYDKSKVVKIIRDRYAKKEST